MGGWTSGGRRSCMIVGFCDVMRPPWSSPPLSFPLPPPAHSSIRPLSATAHPPPPPSPLSPLHSSTLRRRAAYIDRQPGPPSRVRIHSRSPPALNVSSPSPSLLRPLASCPRRFVRLYGYSLVFRLLSPSLDHTYIHTYVYARTLPIHNTTRCPHVSVSIPVSLPICSCLRQCLCLLPAVSISWPSPSSLC